MTDELAPLDLDRLLEGIVASCVEAGSAIMAVYATDFTVEAKGDASPVTMADTAAEDILLADLARLAPDVPVVAEEQVAAGNVPVCGRRFFLVDPLDGTREFISRNGDFTVNVALIEDGIPVLGVVSAPARGELFAGIVGQGAWRADVGTDGVIGTQRPIVARQPPAHGLTAVASRSHRTPETDLWLAGQRIAELVSVGSSLKLCLVAAGEADVYPRLGPTMEWDIAAGDAVLRAAGGRVMTLEDVPVRYLKRGFRNGNFVAWGRSPSG